MIAAVFSGFAVLNLMWFAAAPRTTLADAGKIMCQCHGSRFDITTGAVLYLDVALEAVLRKAAG